MKYIRFNDQDSPAKRQAVQQVRRHFVDERKLNIGFNPLDPRDSIRRPESSWRETLGAGEGSPAP
jgi:hypothetical protein